MFYGFGILLCEGFILNIFLISKICTTRRFDFYEFHKFQRFWRADNCILKIFNWFSRFGRSDKLFFLWISMIRTTRRFDSNVFFYRFHWSGWTNWLILNIFFLKYLDDPTVGFFLIDFKHLDDPTNSF